MNTPTPTQSHTSRSVILVATSIVGGLALLGALTSPVVFGMRMFQPWPAAEGMLAEEYTGGDEASEIYADAVGVTSVDIHAMASDFRLVFDDIEEAVLSVRGTGTELLGSLSNWTLERDGDELKVNCETRCLAMGGYSTTLTLPLELGEDRAVDLDVELKAGAFATTGSFDELDLEVNAGDLTVEGDARSLDLKVNAGDATVTLADVEGASAQVNAGDTTLTLLGEAPKSVKLTANMGSMTVTLPQDSYHVVTKRALGEINNRLQTTKDAAHTVEVYANAAEVVLR